MTFTYPKAAKLTAGYDPKEDRLFLIFHLQDGGFRKAFVSRRILGALLGHMSQKLSASHPGAGWTAQRDEVLQMEHVASVSVRSTEPNQSQQLPSEFSGCFFIIDAQLEMQQDVLVVGFSGEVLKAENQAPEPIEALALGRGEAHQVLRLLRDKADSAGWNLEITAQWMKPMEYGKGLGSN